MRDASASRRRLMVSRVEQAIMYNVHVTRNNAAHTITISDDNKTLSYVRCNDRVSVVCAWEDGSIRCHWDSMEIRDPRIVESVLWWIAKEMGQLWSTRLSELIPIT